MRATTSVAPEDSLERAAAEMRRNGCGILPVVEDDAVLGVITEASLAESLANGVDHREAASTAMIPGDKIPPYATGAQALRVLAENGGLPLLVVDDRNRLMGLVSSSDLYPRRRVLPRPAMVGGMATPFGVYLTNGSVRAGAPWYGLMATGGVLFTLLVISELISEPFGNWLYQNGLNETWAIALSTVAMYGLFFLGMRLIPLSGTHGAEHQVVHAIERGEELTPSVVRRMPRVHPRCGTNMAVAAGLFMGVFSIEWIPNHFRFLASVLITVGLWRRIGSVMQQHVTTRRPSDAQLASGIRAGEELLEKYARSRVATPSFPTRLWNSGLFHVMAGSTLTMGIFYALAKLFHLPIDIGTIS